MIVFAVNDHELKDICIAGLNRPAGYATAHLWIRHCMKMFGVAENMIGLLLSSMRTLLTAGNEVLDKANMRRGIFQGDSLFPMLITNVICIVRQGTISAMEVKQRITYPYGRSQITWEE